MSQVSSVLLVDDDDIANFLNLRVVANSKITNRIEIRKNGREALEYLKECEQNEMQIPELILLDLHMPRMDAREFLEEFKNLEEYIRQRITIVLLTDSTQKFVKKFCSEYQIEKYLFKPLSAKSLLGILNQKQALQS